MKAYDPLKVLSRNRLPAMDSQAIANPTQSRFESTIAYVLRAQRKCEASLIYTLQNPLEQLNNLMEGVKTWSQRLIINFQPLADPVNVRVSQQIKLKEDGSTCKLFLAAVFLAAFVHLQLTNNFIDDTNAHYLFMFMRWRVKTHSFFYILLAGDEIVVLTTISVKAFVAALPAFLVGYRKRDDIFHFLEVSSQLYRSLLPVSTWVFSLTDENSLFGYLFGVFGYFLALLYLIWKVTYDVKKYLRRWAKSLSVLLKDYKHDSENRQFWNKIVMCVTEVKGQEYCPICYENFDQPLLLQCLHAFCEKCLTTWFSLHRPENQAQKCPLCTTITKIKVGAKPKYWDGYTVTQIFFV